LKILFYINIDIAFLFDANGSIYIIQTSNRKAFEYNETVSNEIFKYMRTNVYESLIQDVVLKNEIFDVKLIKNSYNGYKIIDLDSYIYLNNINSLIVDRYTVKKSPVKSGLFLTSLIDAR